MAIEMQGIINELLEGSIKTVGKIPVINELNVTENGTYTPPSGVDGFAPVNVNVPIPSFSSIPLDVTANGEYTPPSGIDGFSRVNVAVPIIDFIIDNKIVSNTSANPYITTFETPIELGWYVLSLDTPSVGNRYHNYVFYFNGNSWSSGEIDLNVAVYVATLTPTQLSMNCTWAQRVLTYGKLSKINPNAFY